MFKVTSQYSDKHTHKLIAYPDNVKKGLLSIALRQL